MINKKTSILRSFLIEWEENGEARNLVIKGEFVEDVLKKSHGDIKSDSCTVTPLYNVEFGKDGGLELK